MQPRDLPPLPDGTTEAEFFWCSHPLPVSYPTGDGRFIVRCSTCPARRYYRRTRQ